MIVMIVYYQGTYYKMDYPESIMDMVELDKKINQ